MSQHAPHPQNIRVVAELAAVLGEMANMQSRVSMLIRDLSLSSTALPVHRPDVRNASKALNDSIERCNDRVREVLLSESGSRTQQTAPSLGKAPSAQDEARPVRVGKGSDERSVGEVGVGERPDQSEQFVTVTGAGGESAASADTAPVPDEPLIPRGEIPKQPPYKPAGPAVGDSKVLNPGRVQGRIEPEHRVVSQETRQKVLDRYAAFGECATDIDTHFSLGLGMARYIIEAARKDGLPQVTLGDEYRAKKLTRRSAPKAEIKAERAPTQEPAASLLFPMNAGDPVMIVDAKGQRIIGPSGEWNRCPAVVCKSLSVLVDGQLRGLDRMATAGGWSKPQQVEQCLPNWKPMLAKIGIDLVHTKGIGVKLNRLDVAAA